MDWLDDTALTVKRLGGRPSIGQASAEGGGLILRTAAPTRLSAAAVAISAVITSFGFTFHILVNDDVGTLPSDCIRLIIGKKPL